MSASSIFRNGRGLALLSWLVTSIMLGAGGSVYALDPDRETSQYIHDRWGADRGFPGGPVYAIAQSQDGYLWIAAEKGLVRFDGLTFRLLEPMGLTLGSGPTVLGLAVDPDGSVWARLRGPALVRYRNGSFESVDSSRGERESVVTAMLRARDGSLLLAPLGQGAVKYRQGTFETVAPLNANPNSIVMAIAESDKGDIWLGMRDAGLVHVEGSQVKSITAGLPDQKINCILPGPDGEVWIGTDRGVARWTGREVTTAGVPAALGTIAPIDMIRDRDHNIWIAAGSRGLLRVNAGGVAASENRGDGARANVTTVFEDRDGNIWLGTSEGIERLRDGVFTTYDQSQRLPGAGVGPVHVDSAHRAWFGPSTGGLYWLREGVVEHVTQAGFDNDVVYSIAGDHEEIWVGRQRGGLTRIRPSADGLGVERWTQADGLAQNSVYVVHRARDGAVWAGTLSGGVSRYGDGAFRTYTATDGLASNTVSAILDSADGQMWFGTPNGVSALSARGWGRYTQRDGLPSNEVNALLEDSEGDVWIGTAGGLALVRKGALEPIQSFGVLRASILGLAQDRSGGLWIATADRVLRVSRDRLAAGTLTDEDVRIFDAADGLRSLAGVKRHRSVVSDGDGRIWIATSSGLSVTDPARSIGRVAPALTHVEQIAADGASFNLRAPVTIPAGRQRLTLSYAGLSLAVPERVMFKYRLDGFDRDWSGPLTTREAVYTNLAPGPYVFRVMASNSDGVWNGAEASVGFRIEPRMWQTTSFRLLAVALVALAVWAAYRIRVRQVAALLNLRFEERLDERTRIAQELHDTLLQGFLSASMQLHVAAEKVPADSPVRASLGHVLRLMRQVIDEGRNAVRGLRTTSAGGDDLEQALSRVPADVAPNGDVRFRVIVEGHRRPLHPIIRDELYRIGREAMVNSFRHSGAGSIEVQLEYARSHLRMAVRDNGSGIDEDVLRSGRDGHFGLSGMRERANRIGADLKVWSRAGAGTEVELSVPGHAAYGRDEGKSKEHI